MGRGSIYLYRRTLSSPPSKITTASSCAVIVELSKIYLVQNYKNVSILNQYQQEQLLLLNCILFTKLPWSGDSEGIFSVFESSCLMLACLPHTLDALHSPFNCRTSIREGVNTNFYSLWFDPTWNRTEVYRFNSRRFIHSTIFPFDCKRHCSN